VDYFYTQQNYTIKSTTNYTQKSKKKTLKTY